MISQCMEPKKTALHIQRDVSSNVVKMKKNLNPKQHYFCVNSGRSLGHIVCKEGLLVDPKKVEVIKGLPPPTIVRGIQILLGQATYHCKLIWIYAKIATPLYLLLKEQEKYIWTKFLQEASEETKEKLTTIPILITPN